MATEYATGGAFGGMLSEQNDVPAPEATTRLQKIMVLHHAGTFARGVSYDPWQFAVELSYLNQAGATQAEITTLLMDGLILHGRESTLPDSVRRTFHRSPNMAIDGKSCFVISPEGLNAFRNAGLENSSQITRFAPIWHSDVFELRFVGQLIKRFKWRAPNQERILQKFHEDGWPERIDDPLPIDDNVDPRRRLHDAIKCLNRRHSRNLVRFHGDGTGEGVVWRIVSAAEFANRKQRKSTSLGRI